MQVISISFNENKDETKVVFTKGFHQHDCVAKLDLLSDAIATLQEYHDIILKESGKDFDRKRLDK